MRNGRTKLDISGLDNLTAMSEDSEFDTDEDLAPVGRCERVRHPRHHGYAWYGCEYLLRFSLPGISILWQILTARVHPHSVLHPTPRPRAQQCRYSPTHTPRLPRRRCLHPRPTVDPDVREASPLSLPFFMKPYSYPPILCSRSSSALVPSHSRTRT